METYSLRTVADIVKDEGKNRFSRDEDTLASGSGIVRLGTVLGALANGKLKPLKPSATDGTQTAVAVILETADATKADATVVTLKRRAQVVLQSLIFPDGITDDQRRAALAQLNAAGIVARMGV